MIKGSQGLTSARGNPRENHIIQAEVSLPLITLLDVTSESRGGFFPENDFQGIKIYTITASTI